VPVVEHYGPRSVTTGPTTYDSFTVSPLTPTIGAEIAIDLRAVDDAIHRDLHQALLDWKVLFFRDQRLSVEQHRDFGARWGELEVHPFLPEGDIPEVVRFEKSDTSKGYENIWHSDVTWRQVPSMGSILRAREVPAVGGDTLWADMGAAYDGLSDDVKERIDGLTAIHDFALTFGLAYEGEELERLREQYPPAEHPVVRTHPETGRKTLFVNEIFTSHIVDMDATESDALLRELTKQSRIPEYQCRFRWSVDAIAFWDNRATQHYAVSDYWPSRRVMERVTVVGDRPF
jgi:taurine dioxygenase